MYRFQQQTDTSEWKIQIDKDPSDPWKFALQHKAQRISILSLSGDPEITEVKDMRYQGPLYFDIDFSKDELQKALDAGVELCEKLMALGVREHYIEIHLSGSKGIHVFVPQAVFSNDRPVASLAAVYKVLATDLYVPGLDMAVYSAGKGRMFRPTNARRPDGAYKTPVTFQELKSLTADMYEEWVSQPREDMYVLEKDPAKAPQLLHLFEAVRKRAAIEPVKHKSITAESLGKMNGEIPPCVEDLCAGKERGRTAFNSAAVNLGCWSANSGIDISRVDSVFTRVSEATTSKKYNTVLKRKRHLQGMHAYVKDNDKYQFSCLGMLSVITTHPCTDCPIRDSGGLMTSSEEHEDMYVFQRLGQYYSDKECTKVIASFNMEVQSLVTSENNHGKIEACHIVVTSPISGDTHEVTDFSEDAWTSKQKFKQELAGLSGVAFLGGEDHVSKLRLTITKQDLSKESEVMKKHKHAKSGVSYYRVSGDLNPRSSKHKGICVYVEGGGFSMDSNSYFDTHVLTFEPQGVPVLKLKDWNAPVSEEANEVFALLMKTNTKHVVATFLGWILASHIKAHLMELTRQFPLLYVSGMAGTGKNCLTALWLRLCGMEGEEAKHTLEAPNCTKLPFQIELANTSTIPRVINEMNPKSVKQAHYQTITEILKACWDSQSINKGVLGGGDRSGMNVSVQKWTLTSPVITLSEEPITMPALLQRGLKLQLDPDGHDQGSEAFYQIEHRADVLAEIALPLIKHALGTRPKDIALYMEENRLPKEVMQSDIPDRLKYSYQVMLAAYDWGIEALSQPGVGFSQENLEIIKQMKQTVASYVHKDSDAIIKSSSVTEPARILKDIALLAHFGNDSNSMHKIIPGKHYAIRDNKLYLDITVIYHILQQAKRSSGMRLAIQSEEAFVTSAKGLKYFLSDTETCEDLIPSTKGRTVCMLDMDLMGKANIPVSMFIPDF